jgi:hypothetical protein
MASFNPVVEHPNGQERPINLCDDRNYSLHRQAFTAHLATLEACILNGRFKEAIDEIGALKQINRQLFHSTTL